ncbi:MAG: SUMF1/EgtB/PvdO family nonheme iron enzyme [Sedimentisphaerales bacterium]
MNYNVVIGSPWDITNGTQEQNGTFDMMGNVWEWNEALINGSYRGVRGGSYTNLAAALMSSNRGSNTPIDVGGDAGFRVASVVPEPCNLVLLFIGGIVLRNRKR